jgi:4'-phosphopantetheinyl transferase
MQRMPHTIQQRINRYRRWEDKQARLFGKLLILEGVSGFGNSGAGLNDLSFDSFGRPFINGQIDFNLSHSDEYVACAFTDAGRVGIDLERIRPIDLSELNQYLTAQEWENIRRASDSSQEFYRLWTSKESILKADGRGLAVDLREIRIEGQKAALQGHTWFLREIEIDPHYSCHVATNQQDFEHQVREVAFE